MVEVDPEAVIPPFLHGDRSSVFPLFQIPVADIIPGVVGHGFHPSHDMCKTGGGSGKTHNTCRIGHHISDGDLSQIGLDSRKEIDQKAADAGEGHAGKLSSDIHLPDSPLSLPGSTEQCVHILFDLFPLPVHSKILLGFDSGKHIQIIGALIVNTVQFIQNFHGFSGIVNSHPVVFPHKQAYDQKQKQGGHKREDILSPGLLFPDDHGKNNAYCGNDRQELSHKFFRHQKKPSSDAVIGSGKRSGTQLLHSGILQIFVVHGKALAVQLFLVQLPGIIHLLIAPLPRPHGKYLTQKLCRKGCAGIKKQCPQLLSPVHAVHEKTRAQNHDIRAYCLQNGHKKRVNHDPFLPCRYLLKQKPDILNVLSAHKTAPPSLPAATEHPPWLPRPSFSHPAVCNTDSESHRSGRIFPFSPSDRHGFPPR